MRGFKGWGRSTEQKRACNAHALEALMQNAAFKGFDVYGNIGKLGHYVVILPRGCEAVKPMLRRGLRSGVSIRVSSRGNHGSEYVGGRDFVEKVGGAFWQKHARGGIITPQFKKVNTEEDAMKKLAIGLLSVLALACLAGVGLAQGPDRGTSEITFKGEKVSVEYGRPALKGRTTDELLGRLKPGGLWRLGANTSTTFKTEIDLLAFGDVTIPAGEYSIWMQLQADNSWKLLFDKKHGQWGEPTPDPSECFAAAPLSNSKPASSLETLTLTLSKSSGGGKLTIHWGTLEEVATFKAR